MEARELYIAGHTTAEVVAEHSHMMITMDRRIPAVQVESEEVVMVRLVALH
jgi:hypothetical protein